MSIYATLREARVNGRWVVVQGVPGHIFETGPTWDFLTPPISDEDSLRTVFVIMPYTPKGTARNGQEYRHWLLRLTGQEYAETPWPVLRRRIAKALREVQP